LPTKPSHWAALLGIVACNWVIGCSTDTKQVERNDRAKMEQVKITIKGHTFNVAVARTPKELELGLMHVKPDEMGQDEGMLFVFPRQQPLSFWMKNTVMPLDIAFINVQDKIVKTHTMKALDESQYPSIQPAQFALEVHAGRLAALSIGEGDTVEMQGTR
jgi:hypothetical protein